MADLVRFCITLPIALLLGEPNDTSYEFTGPVSQAVNKLTDFVKSTSKNSSIYATTSTEECLERMKNNQSDMTSSMFLYHESSHYYQIPVPMFVSQIEFMVGYKLDEKTFKPVDYGTVFTNVSLLSLSVYFLCAVLILSFLFIVCVSTWIHQSFSLSNCRRLERKKSRKRTFIKAFILEARMVFYRKSKRLRLTNFLFAILCFYLITCFMIIYKTSRIIVEQPFVVTDYQQLIADKTALPAFYDFKIQISQKFKSAPPASLKGKIWSKLVKSGTVLTSAVHSTYDLDKLDRPTVERFEEMNQNHSVIFASSIIMNLLRSWSCASSWPGPLRRLLVYKDDSEGEELLGYALSRSFFEKRRQFITARLRWLFESHLIIEFYKGILDVSNLAYALKSVPKEYQNRQNLACNNKNSFGREVFVKSICLEYFLSFFALVICLYFLAKMVSVYEILLA